MKIISPANETVIQMLRRFVRPSEKYRFLKYLVCTEVDEGILLFNLFTKELLLLSHDEYATASKNSYLQSRWFVVPSDTNEKDYVDLIRDFLKSKQGNLTTITGYSIFTTTDCNARCFYCFENGIKHSYMSKETALKVVAYIKNHHNGKQVKINWFGGEPLLNTEVIDIISDGLKKESIDFKSRMITNGYLFDKAMIDRAINAWNLTELQITLDGTEKAYNRIKAYIYDNCNPYDIVLDNTNRLLDAGLSVSIRLNVDRHNSADLLNLVDELYEKLGNQRKLYIYVHRLFDEHAAYSIEASLKAEELEIAIKDIEDKLYQYRFKPQTGITKALKTFHCMADCGTCITILPDGEIGLCEVRSKSGYIGHIDTEGFNQEIIKSWKETRPEIPECKDCFYYPECYKLKKCSGVHQCYQANRDVLLRKTVDAIINQYNYFRSTK